MLRDSLPLTGNDSLISRLFKGRFSFGVKTTLRFNIALNKKSRLPEDVSLGSLLNLLIIEAIRTHCVVLHQS